MRFLIILLVVGLGYAAYAVLRYLYELLGLKKEQSRLLKTDWLKLAVLSVSGIILLLILQNILQPYGRPTNTAPLMPALSGSNQTNGNHFYHHGIP